MTKYRSTRGDVRNYSFEEAVLSGLASDRGLFVPEEDSFPSLPPNALTEWASLSYQDLAVEILSLFIDAKEIPRRDLEVLVKKAYTFGDANYRHKDVAPLVKVKGNLHVLELFHGPTFAFKDIALQFLGHLFEYFLERKNKHSDSVHQVTVVGATSGDTGSSAIYGLRNKKNVEVFILYPNGRVSDIQEQQMTSVLDDSVHNLAVQGTFDDCQAIVKDLFADAAFKKKYNLGAVNSINWARILAQIVYYFYAYFRLPTHDKVAFSVPTGNFGDILAGFYAKRLGLPLDKLIVATNDNDILHRFFSSGKYHRTHVNHTTSPSMDICVSSNFERYLFALGGDDAVVLKDWMTKFESTGKLTVQGSLLKKAQADMSSYSVLEPEVQATIKQYHVHHDYLFDPHTAIGVAAADHYLESESPDATVVVLATAHYGKFLPTVLDALKEDGGEVKQHPILKALETLPRRSHVIENSVVSVKAFVESHVQRRDAKEGGGFLSGLPQSLLLQGSLVVAAAGLVAFYALKK
ncbi:threonine synthase [Aphanomyces astaci]|uniref:Threonine synthase n=1 Tax=Aphanomyces astaci TaxID=112090 RepID=W4FM74_APHAT|nr:threonine synthase [Aphanomyces astaci]ETV68607.1 threonine synthase [Aphanomyces astaci]|eukprot:XP_009841832.1 threonine synthase [Aphanomyces astaci]